MRTMDKLIVIADRVSSYVKTSENSSCQPFVNINFVIQNIAIHLIAPATP